MKTLGAIVLWIIMPVLIIIAFIEPTFLGEVGVIHLFGILGVGSFAGWLLGLFRD